METKTIGQRIAHYRELSGLSQSELARRLAVKPQAVQKWESGGAPRTKRLEDIARELKTPVENLVGGADFSTPGTEGRWPFSKITYQQFLKLPDPIKSDIEDYIEMRATKAMPLIDTNKRAA